MIAAIVAWWHAHVVADEETSARLSAVDADLDREEAPGVDPRWLW